MGIAYSSYTWFLKEDLSFGTEFYSALTYCPDYLLEAAKLSVFFESLLNNNNLRSLVAATMHNIQPRAGTRIEENTFVNLWYKYLDKRYNFTLGPAVLSLFTTDELEQLISLETSFLEHVEDHCKDKSK